MELYNLTIHELNSLILSKKVSIIEITDSILSRINKIEDYVGSYITLCSDEAIKSAAEIQSEIDKSGCKLPLMGIPMGIKDNICTKGIKTTCASRMLENFIPPYSATVVQKLNTNKAILIGKLNMDEFAMGSSTESSYFKLTRNPWDLKRVPGGSSGGSAAAVTAGEAVFSLGTDTGGSIRQPAAFCGVVGMKPTYGLVSRFGLVAFASSLDQIGPITKDVEDCAIVLNVLAGYDKNDSTSVDSNHLDYTKALVNDVKGMKIGIPKEYITENMNDEVEKAMFNAVKVFENLGAECEEFSLPMTEYVLPVYYIISSAEASSNLARFDGVKYGYRAKNYSDLNDMYVRTRSEGFGYEVKKRIVLGAIVLSGDNYVKYYEKALKLRRIISECFYKLFDKYDIIISPSTSDTAFKTGKNSVKIPEMSDSNFYTAAANLTGLPGISIPCGFDKEGLPIGLHMMSGLFAESTLLRAAYTFEQNTIHHRKKPN